MAIRIIRREGVDDGRVIAVWEEGEGFTQAEPGLRFADDPVYEQYTREMMLSEFDGPDHFAVPDDADTTKSSEPSVESNQMLLTKTEDRTYVENVHEAPDDVVVEVDEDDNLYYEP